MIDKFLSKIIGTKHDREMKRLQPLAQSVNDLEQRVRMLSDGQIRSRADEIKQKLRDEGAALDDFTLEVFSLVREASKRTTGMRHFDVQIIGGLVLHEGKIAEMRTGEGKTLVAPLAVSLNALAGKGVHVVTVNDYLARRDAGWMGPIYQFLGLSVGVIQHDLDDRERQEAYGCDVTYGTNNEFGFDYLRDNMKFSKESFVQREHHYAIVDEVDSILVDEARTPLIISGPAEESTEKYFAVDRLVPNLRRDRHYQVDEKARTVTLTEEGVERCESLLNVTNLYDPGHIDTVHQLYQSLKAHTLFRRDVDYMVIKGEDGRPEVVIVDEFTGRLMPGRRYSDGLHQALEAKEKVPIHSENQTLASVTFQNYFRMYDKLAGMTGTAETEASEFHQIYKLDVVVIPTNKPMIRKDHADIIYLTEEEKFRAVTEEIIELNQRGQPMLVGTVSIEKSEKLSSLLRRRGIKHVVLNAKHHEKEAEIVAKAGQKGAVTIATNMAGRGTDIVLGKGVIEVGGLHIIGTERHEARRIDNQLRGRSGRQGDPGASRFYLSLEDDLMRIFGGDRFQNIMERIGMREGDPIEHSMVTKAIERAQKQVEGHNFEIRKHLLEYDDVMNKQREAFYSLRREILMTKDSKKYLLEVAEVILKDFLDRNMPDEKDPRDWNVEQLAHDIRDQYGLDIDAFREKFDELSKPELEAFIKQRLDEHYTGKEQLIPAEVLRRYERDIMLYRADENWKNHLFDMDHLKEGIGLRGYGQRDPLIEYKRESFDLFQAMMDRIDEQMVRYLFLLQPASNEEASPVRRQPRMVFQSGDSSRGKAKPVQTGKKTGRNEPCPCGSGKKFKKCCGA